MADRPRGGGGKEVVVVTDLWGPITLLVFFSVAERVASLTRAGGGYGTKDCTVQLPVDNVGWALDGVPLELSDDANLCTVCR